MQQQLLGRLVPVVGPLQLFLTAAWTAWWWVLQEGLRVRFSQAVLLTHQVSDLPEVQQELEVICWFVAIC
jgi:hypothetical protein